MAKYKRVVVKVGTKVITSKERTLDRERIRNLVEQLSDVRDRGTEVLLVTSGAIGAGMGLLGLKKRPALLSELQASAAIGQGHLMQFYSEYFRARSYLTGQILLTQEDLNDRKRYLNIKHTILALLGHGVIPVINENDTVSTDEIKCGDNDRLSALVADLCGADMLILLTDVDGLLDEDGRVIKFVEEINSRVAKLGGASRCDLGTGGMATKLAAARSACEAGMECVIANGTKKGIIPDILDGKAAGTAFKCQGVKFLAKKRWIAFSSRTKGRIEVDDGAREALSRKDRSLLASGVLAVSGDFSQGDAVSVVDRNGKEFARGLVNYSSEAAAKIKGLKTSAFKAVLGYKGPDEVIHKDNLVIL
ncbi:MAG: glutamate 5-kinase [Candidatus Omnitrophota bacterium]